jgi:hypothetical protein
MNNNHTIRVKLVIFNIDTGKTIKRIPFRSFSLLQAAQDCKDINRHLPTNQGAFII